MDTVNCERCGGEILAFYGPGTYHCGACADPGVPLAWNDSVPKCLRCDCSPCMCDGPHGPLSTVYYDEAGTVASVYQGERRYRIFFMPDRETYRIEVDQTIYDAANNVEQGGKL